ncbi:MAG: PEP-CTERM sorting domain-containing protein [Microcystis aeruginosa Ma_QC_Ch_20071001_S25D]|uniref:PEP-CTERM sorting domain-containing protein n=1 Tax=Microcystis aeruginosa Ma_QC_Ch_20071001_S25D TaxID=2486250 RepID=A0A552FVT0_MICAE|nr:MAG: PEP-CTERM sorting domain-containing protein [Microcystis aeruginosa Ma_QC_Ch_20071001_S25D]TRU56557.1 MAG: PEP-CTERM sorting domain-containing protein [Microcystis aeruginosa Ma_QC_Ch_20071001_M135]
MITNISRQLTTGALAIASSVAAFGFAGAAPAQAQAVCTPQAFTTFMSTPCRKGDKLFTYISSSGNQMTHVDNFLTITQSTMPRIHSFTFTPGNPLSSASGVQTLSYSIEIVDDPLTLNENEALTQMFSTYSAGYTTTGMTDKGVSLQQSTLHGISTAKSIDIGGTGSPGNVITVAAGVKKLFVTNTFSVSIAGGQLDSITNAYTQKSIDIPEPSAILGILAVAGAGAFARRKS